MPDRPSKIWKEMPIETRVQAADAFWRDGESPEIQVQHVEAIVALARRLNFRAKSVQALSVERRAKALAQMADVSDAIATRALIAYHFRDRRPLMGAFLDALGVAHDNGMITEEDLAPPARDRIQKAIESVRETHPAGDVELYLRTLVALDGDTWANLDDAMTTSG
ncbi:MAG TPA: hypothetical protein VFO19_21720 [Vicinamibacterales bacterium]|nr:hypothetical protein [Vicinamibacterales bacterium]